jgi:hypothetical protein
MSLAPQIIGQGEDIGSVTSQNFVVGITLNQSEHSHAEAFSFNLQPRWHNRGGEAEQV